MTTDISNGALRTQTEKILYPMALIFSSLVWLLLIGGALSSLFFGGVLDDVTAIEPCIYPKNGINSEAGWDVVPMEKASSLGVRGDCIDNELLTIEEMREAQAQAFLANDSLGSAAIPIFSSMVLFYIFLILAAIYVSAGISMAFIRLNGVRISETQYAAFYQVYKKAAENLGIGKLPHAYIIHATGELNAFAIKIARRRMIVFYAELIETLVENNRFDELRAVAAHELTHVKLKHVNYWIFLMPFMAIPFLAKMLSRAREYSADRGAMAVCGDKEVVSQALLKLVTGKMIAKDINIDEYLAQPKSERGLFTWLARIISTHPPMPHRIAAVRNNRLE